MNSRSDRHEVSTPKTIRIVVNSSNAAKTNGAKSHSPKAAVLGSKARRNMVECTGRLFQKVGLPRSTGQIYGLLYLSKKPQSLDDIVVSLELSKGSASNGPRHLISLGAIRQVWVPGERRDYFESVGDISSVVRSIYLGFLRPRFGA